jgi:FkbM family methyltransferase
MSFRRFIDILNEHIGLGRSVLMYYGIPFHNRALTRFYAQFIQPGDLCFDIGAHVGNRLLAWSRLQANIVAIEPQPQCMQLLRHWYGHQPTIALVEQAVGAVPGTQTLWISRRSPTVTTLSRSWITRVQQTPGFASVDWDRAVSVTITTLDNLIVQHGVPVFCKIDVEGMEQEVLKGLSVPLHSLSFEYIPAASEIALGCIDRLNQLGSYEYNWAVSEWPRLRSATWLGPKQMTAYLQRMRSTSRSGDIYARRVN